MKTAFIMTFVANIILLAVSVAISPEKVAIHFGPGGSPDSWAPSYVNAILMTGIHILVLLAFLLPVKLMSKIPKSLINLPNKDYWLSDENRKKTESIIAWEMYFYGTGIFVFMIVVGLLALQANLSTPVKFREDLFWWPFGLFIGFTVYWTIRLMTRFKVPQGELR